MALKKAEYEKILLETIENIGLEKYCSMHGEGHKRNHEYYQFSLKDGTQRYLVNPSQSFKDTLEID